MSFSILPENCKYRAEGNAGLVIQLIKEGTVLRLRKQEDAFKTDSNTDDDLKELESQIEILNNVLKPILGESFVNIPIIVFLKREDVQILNEAMKRFRPVHRRHKTVTEKNTYVCMLPDYCSIPQSLKHMPAYGPELCIEVKPKQGFTKDEYLPTDLFVQHLPLCRFCMMQNYKMVKGLISSKTGYCPMDLYSGYYERMLHALKMLFETPQNNLRIFKNQKLIYSEEKKDNLNGILADFTPSVVTSLVDFLGDLIIQVLLKPFPFGIDKALLFPQKECSQNCINAHKINSNNGFCSKLPLYSVLERVLSGQLLDDLPIAKLYQLYQEIKESKEQHSNHIGCYSRAELPPFVGELNQVPSESNYQYASRKVWEFLVSLVFKDCSIMLTLKHLSLNSSNEAHAPNIISDSYGNLYVFSIAIADLDAKSLHKVEKVYNDFLFMIESLMYEK